MRCARRAETRPVGIRRRPGSAEPSESLHSSRRAAPQVHQCAGELQQQRDHDEGEDHWPGLDEDGQDRHGQQYQFAVPTKLEGKRYVLSAQPGYATQRAYWIACPTSCAATATAVNDLPW